MADHYYIRIRGEVKGPLTREQIATQIRRKRLGRHHELSADAVSWQKAGDMAEFFEPAVAARTRAVEPKVDSRNSEQIQLATESGSESVANAVNDEWYYTKGGQKLGPVPASEIQMWLSNGALNASVPVWHSSFDSWIPAGELPQFAAIAGSREQPSPESQPQASFWEIFMGTSRAAQLPTSAIDKYPNLTRYLRIAESCLRIIFVLLLFLSVAALLYMVGRSFYESRWEGVVGAMIAGPLQVLVLWLLFISCMAALEFVRVVIKIEDNTSR